MLLAACGQGASPASPSAGGAASGDWKKQWDSWVAGAKQEGKLVLASGPSPAARTTIPDTFGKQFGLEVEYIGGATSDLANRLRSEQAANQFTVDVAIAGADTAYLVLYGEHLIEPVAPHLIYPEAIDPAAWKNGKMWFMDPDQQYIVRLSNYSSPQVFANADFIKSDEPKSWKDMLQPQFTGKIAGYDPIKNGSGSQEAAYIYNTLGGDFIKSLYVDQAVQITQDYRQLSDWLARGIYPMALGTRTEDTEQLKKDGFNVKPLGPFPEAPGYVSAGFGLLHLLKSPPHPNAAKLFLNWALTKDGQRAWNSSQKTVGVRNDIDNSWAPSYIVPQPGVNYFDIYNWDYTTNGGYTKANNGVKSILGQ